MARAVSGAERLVKAFDRRLQAVQVSETRRRAAADGAELPEDTVDQEKPFPLFRNFIARAMPEFRYVKARSEIVDTFQDLEDGKLADAEGRRIDRVLIRAPTQLGKTVLGGLFIAWRARNHQVMGHGCTTYNDKRAGRLARAARTFYLRSGGTMAPGARGIQDWQNESGGGIWCYSISSGQTGNPGNTLLMDDPVKDYAEAISDTVRKRNENWYGTSWLSRWSAEHGRLVEVIIGTPWTDTDIQSYALKVRGGVGEGVSPHWYVVALQGICDRAGYPLELPDGCVLRADWRKPGQPLEPTMQKFTRAAIEGQLASNGGPLSLGQYSAMVQQAPKPAQGGDIVDQRWFKQVGHDRQPLTHRPRGMRAGYRRANTYVQSVRAWDLAATEGKGNYTAGVLVGLKPKPERYTIRHMARGRKRRPQDLIAAVMLLDGPETIIRLPEDPAAGGKVMVDTIVRHLRRIATLANVQQPTVRTFPVNRSKADRFDVAATAIGPVSQLADGTVDRYGLFEIVTEWQDRRDEFTLQANAWLNWEQWQHSEEDYDHLEQACKIAEALIALPSDDAAAKALNVESGNWWTSVLADCASINREGGGRWDVPDALADAYDHLHLRRDLSALIRPE